MDIGRGVGALLVVYTHVDMLFLRQNHGRSTWVTNAVDTLFAVPLRLTDQGVGAVSVPFFFLVSGFMVTAMAVRSGARRFGVNRVWRVYPPLAVAVAIGAVAFTTGLRPLTTGAPGPVTLPELVGNLTLANFLHAPCAAYVGAAWTIAVEIMFYLLLAAMIPVLRRATWLAIAIELDLVFVVLCTHALGGPDYHAFVVNVAYLTIPLMGQALWAGWTKRVPPWAAGLFVLVAWALFRWSGDLDIDPDYIPRPLPVGYAFALLLIGLLAERKLVRRKVWIALSERSYSIYLLHGVVAFPVMHLLIDRLPLWATLTVGLATTAAAVELSYRFVERPSHDLGRRLARRRPTRIGEEAAEVTATSGSG